MATQVPSTVPAAQRILTTNEQVTGPVAAEALRQSGILDDASHDIRVLDNATGGGILISELLKARQNPAISSITAGDISPPMLAASTQRSAAEQWTQTGTAITISELDQEHPDLPSEHFDYIFNNFGIFFSRDDSATLTETLRLLKPGGKALFTSWKSIAWWASLAVPAVRRFLPEAPALPDPMSMFKDAWNDPERAEAKLTAAGFRNVRTEEFAFAPDVDGKLFAEACAMLVGITVKRAWAEEEFARFGPGIGGTLEKYLAETSTDGRWEGRMFAVVSMGEK